MRPEKVRQITPDRLHDRLSAVGRWDSADQLWQEMTWDQPHSVLSTMCFARLIVR